MWRRDLTKTGNEKAIHDTYGIPAGSPMRIYASTHAYHGILWIPLSDPCAPRMGGGFLSGFHRTQIVASSARAGMTRVPVLFGHCSVAASIDIDNTPRSLFFYRVCMPIRRGVQTGRHRGCQQRETHDACVEDAGGHPRRFLKHSRSFMRSTS
ncbi:hypothetical protein BC834DRAFT_502737 [Gloeopeniophorella convolvens]|nr:hypothetical protein BC834DRAFT_502737 [Gloeopeniophorella convolvens]